MNWNMIVEKIQQTVIIAVLAWILLTLLLILILWHFIKSAVRAGVRDALQWTLSNTVVTVRLKDIANGLVFYSKDVTPQSNSHANQQNAGNQNTDGFYNPTNY